MTATGTAAFAARAGAAPDPPIRLRSPADLSELLGLPFSAQQLAAITAPLEPGLVVAGAGTGKTTVMAARVVWLVGTGQVAAEQILGLTFTTKAASELARRVGAALTRAGLAASPAPAGVAPEPAPAPSAEPTISTYQAYAARLLAEHGLRVGIEPDTRLLDDASRYQLAATAVGRFAGPVDALTAWLPTAVNGVLQLDAELDEHLVCPGEVRAFQDAEAPRWADTKQTIAVRDVVATFAKRGELLDLVEAYRALKAERGAIDFAQQLAMSARLVQERPEVGADERDRFAVVLLDEYQDTSVAQATLLRWLFSDASGAGGLGHPVTAVGDPCQAIYGWRGASVGNIHAFPTQFPRRAGDGTAADAVRFPLSENRRSEREILAAANLVSAPLRAASAGTEQLTAPDGVGAGRVRLAVAETYAEELALLAQQVLAAHRTGRPWSELAVLARDNTMVADIHDRLVNAGVPVEVVGLAGLLRLPEVVEVVDTLEVLRDLTANPALLGLLSGPRWAIGPRDLALLGRRARSLGHGARGPRPGAVADVRARLAEAVSGVDPADLVSLAEALEDPGPASYSAQARIRFAELAGELRELRRHVGEPLLDLVRRVVDAIGIEVELAASAASQAQTRRHNLATFVDAVASFAGSGPDATLDGLLAFLAAEDEYGQGLPLSLPSAGESVKLLTVHRAKGLEWDVVFLPGMSAGVFPPARAPSRWATSPSTLPTPLRGDVADLPTVTERSAAGLRRYVETCAAAALTEERRLAYVAITRARAEVVVSCHWWGPRQVRARGPSTFADDIRTAVEGADGLVRPDHPAPAPGAFNPTLESGLRASWPAEPDPSELADRRAAAELVRAAAADPAAAQRDSAGLSDAERTLVRQWDLEIEALVTEARSAAADEVAVELPASLSTTSLLRVVADPDAVARELARPLPRRPSATARFGTRFHAWVQGHVGRPVLLDPDDLPDRADPDIEGDADLRELVELFRAGPYGERTPVEIEAPFSLVLAGTVVRGRIDAVYAAAGGGFEVVDWKTNRRQSADPLQLAVYRTAWAELAGVPAESVSAAFYYVRTGAVVRPPGLPNRLALERLLIP